MEALVPESIVYRFEPEPSRVGRDLVERVFGTGRKAKLGVPSLRTRAR